MSDQGGPRPDRGGPLRHTRRRRRSRYSVPIPRFRWVALVVVGFLLAGAGGTLTFFWPSITAAVAATGHTITVPSRTPGPAAGASSSPSAAPVPGGAFTVLLMGSDNDSKFTSNGVPVFCCAQSLILMRVQPASGSVTMLSLPRDLWVPMHGAGGAATGHDGKIDQAFGTVGGDGVSGANAEIATIENDFQVHIDHYVWIGLQGLINLINDVGGINIVASHPVMDDNYPYDVGNSTNPFAADRVAVLPGAQHMNGYVAMEYVRSRHDDLSEDLGRTVRQQQVLVALRQRLVGLSVGDVNQIAAALQGQVLTDVPLTQIPTLLGIVKDVGAGNITHVFLSTSQFSNATVGGQSVLVPDMPSILQTVHQYFPAA